MVACPICDKNVKEVNINAHIDSGCQSFLESDAPPSSAPVASFFKTPGNKRDFSHVSSQQTPSPTETRFQSIKRQLDEQATQSSTTSLVDEHVEPPTKKPKVNPFQRAAPLAERMRPTKLDEVCGQELVGPDGVLRGLIETDRLPSMILWGNAGTGKTTIARVIANMVGSRFVEINSTSTGVAECKKIFSEAKSELGLTGRKTIIFCDEIHRFSKSQQDVFLGPVEAGVVTLIGATTENPSFKVQNALLSRCRTFTLTKLTDADIISILNRALEKSRETYQPGSLVDDELLHYLAAFADGDARTSLNLLELAMDLSKRPGMTSDQLKSSLTKTLVYDRSGDQHYDTISAFHKSVRGSDPDAALYYLARMIQSGEDALYIARRMVVIASEDVGLADNSMLSLATATYTAAEKIGMPEARINLAHCTVALCLAPKSTRAYRGLSNATSALSEPGIAGLPIPIHLRNAPTRLMKELGYGKEYKYNPAYVDGRVSQEYLPEKLKGRQFLEDIDLGTERDSEVDYNDDAKPPDESVKQIDETSNHGSSQTVKHEPDRSFSTERATSTDPATVSFASATSPDTATIGDGAPSQSKRSGSSGRGRSGGNGNSSQQQLSSSQRHSRPSSQNVVETTKLEAEADVENDNDNDSDAETKVAASKSISEPGSPAIKHKDTIKDDDDNDDDNSTDIDLDADAGTKARIEAPKEGTNPNVEDGDEFYIEYE